MVKKQRAVDRLRAEAKRLQRNAGNKISRLESKGIRARGSEFDPRIASKRIDGMNSRQLNSHIRRLNSFNARSNQFVSVGDSKPLPLAEWRAYKKAEAAHNRMVQARIDQVGKIGSPESMMTLEQRLAMRTPSIPTMARGQATESAYQFVNRKSA